MRTFNLFVSHSWAYSNNYKNLVNLLESRPYFDFRNYSVPRNDPVHTNGTDRELYRAILQKMDPCSVILILAGVYATYSKWIQKEVEIAREGFWIEKPTVAIEPWGSERTSAFVKDNADRIVRWNTESVVSAIRDLAR